MMTYINIMDKLIEQRVINKAAIVTNNKFNNEQLLM